MAHIVTFEFPISNLGGVTQMHLIPPSSLPNFHGLDNEDPNTFLFGFEVLCRWYDYYTNDQRLKVFPLTLKGAIVQWFMSLCGNCIKTWEEMKNVFLEKYKDYYKANENIFSMIQGEDESFEDYLEWFKYNLQKSKHKHLKKEILKTLILKETKDEILEILNLTGKCDIFQLSYDDVCDLCTRYWRGMSNAGKNSREFSSFLSKSATRIEDIRDEISDSFEHFKVDVISSLNSQVHVLQVKKSQEEFEEVIFPQCQKEHPMDSFSFLPRMKTTFPRDGEAAGISQPLKPWPTCMFQETSSPLSYLHNLLWNTHVLGQPCQSQYNPYQSCPQVWYGSSYDYMTTLSHLVAQKCHPYF